MSENKPRGFSGLLQLVSKIDQSSFDALQRTSESCSSGSPQSQPDPRSADNAVSPTPSHPKESASPRVAKQGKGWLKFILVLLIIGGWLYIQSLSSSSLRSTSSTFSSTTSSPSSGRTASPVPAKNEKFFPDRQAVQPKATPVAPQEKKNTNPETKKGKSPTNGAPKTAYIYSKPAPGVDKLLSLPEICWCMREEITLETQRSIINTDYAIKKFNARIDDYNSRCGQYRYYKRDREQAQRIISEHRQEIVSQARREAKGWN